MTLPEISIGKIYCYNGASKVFLYSCEQGWWNSTGINASRGLMPKEQFMALEKNMESGFLKILILGGGMVAWVPSAYLANCERTI